MACPHEIFQAQVHVHRLTGDANPEVPSHWAAEIRVSCGQCGLPFRWLGLPKGAYWDKNMTDMSGLELRAPLHPADGTTPLPPKVKGFVLAPE